MDLKSWRRPKRKPLPQLLDDPTARRMLRDVEMQDTPAIVADDKETVEDVERDRGHGEEVHRRNRFPVILKKRAPTFGWPGIPRRPLHPAGDGSLGDVKAQHEKLAVNARSTPGWVLRHHAEDQPPELPSTIFSCRPVFSPSRSCSSTCETQCGANLRLSWANDNERLLPRRPKVASEHPEQFVDGSESGLRMLALQDSQLLPESQVLKEQPSAGTKAAGQQSYTQPREAKHGP